MLKIRIDINKNSKIPYYFKNLLRFVVPSHFYQKKLLRLIKLDKDSSYIIQRVNYYNKTSTFSLSKSATNFDTFLREKKKTYFFDLFEYLRYFPSHLRFLYLFGDITTIPTEPTLLKSRPIEGDNSNSVLMKLNKVRHFIFINDTIDFVDKKNILVWRGKCYVEHRINFLKQFYKHELCNVGQTNPETNDYHYLQKPKMQLAEQLQYKFILAIEGNDVASNLKWIMSSNSLAFMVKPKYETWFMEGTLIPNYHYVLLKDDYSDLSDKIQYYTHNIDAALEIINNANAYTQQFKDSKREDVISLLVLKKYFQNSQQI